MEERKKEEESGWKYGSQSFWLCNFLGAIGTLQKYESSRYALEPRHTSLNMEEGGGGRGVFLPFHFPREEFLNEFWSRSIRSPRLEAFFDRLSDIRGSEILRGNGEWVNLLRDSRFVLCIFKCIFVVLSMIPLFGHSSSTSISIFLPSEWKYTFLVFQFNFVPFYLCLASFKLLMTRLYTFVSWSFLFHPQILWKWILYSGYNQHIL